MLDPMVHRPRETRAHFRARVKECTGVPYRAIPMETRGEGDVLPGRILARRGSVFVCTNDYPDTTDESGDEAWSPLPENFVRVYVI